MLLNDGTSSSLSLSLSLFPISTFRFLYPHRCLQFSPIHTWLTNLYFSGTDLSLMSQIHITNYLLNVPPWISPRLLKHNIPQNWTLCFQPLYPTSIVVSQCDHYQGMTKASILASEAEISESSLTLPSPSPRYLLQNHILLIWFLISKLRTSLAWM